MPSPPDSAVLGAPVDRARLLHVDATTLAATTVDAIVRGVDVLCRTPRRPLRGPTSTRSARPSPSGTSNRRRLPLDALDEELGVGFGRGPEGGDPAAGARRARAPGPAGARRVPRAARATAARPAPPGDAADLTLALRNGRSTVRDAERMVVLDQGRIAEQGTHEQLIAGRSLYWYLTTQQLA